MSSRSLSICTLLVIFGTLCLVSHAQVDQSMIDKARAMGMTQDQIDAAIASQSGGKSAGQQGNDLNKGGVPFNNPNSGFNTNTLIPNMLSGRDTSSRWNITPQELDKINPSQLEKAISDKIEMDYQRMQGVASPEAPAARKQFYTSEIEEYEIVIKEGEFIKRPLPVVFGRELFSNKNLTFEPSYTIATPQNYVLGPGDEVVIEVWGTSELYAQEKISPDGTIYINGVGPVQLSGLTIDAARNRMRTKISQAMSGADVNLSLGRIRSIKVNISGEAAVPGTYTLPSLATVFNAIYSAGGVNKIGSLRDVKVYRNNKLAASVDVYDYLINGIYDANIRLEDNDMIIIPPYDSYVTAYGEVRRPRVYEMKKTETVEDLIKYSGGFKGDAYSENVQVKRKNGRQYQISTVDRSDFNIYTLSDGDSVSIGRVIEEYSNRLAIEGAVWRPGEYELSDRLNTLKLLIEKAEGLKGNEFGSRGEIIRRRKDYTKEVISFDVRAIVTGVGDIPLIAEDSVYIPTILELREDYTIWVDGEVNRPDTLPYRDGMTVEDAIVFSGGLKEAASLARIEVARRIKYPNSTTYTDKTADLYTFQISADLKISPEAGRFILSPFDEVYVRRSPGYSEQKRIQINGEVLYPGTYVLATAGERISDVIRKAGDFTPEAYTKGTSVKRLLSEDEKAKIASMLKILTNSTNNDRDSVNATTFDMSDSYPIGVDVVAAMSDPGGIDDIILQEGDQIYVPKQTNIVKISGAVLYPNSVTYEEGSSIKDYISQAGGYSDRARKHPFVIYMNGKVSATKAGKRPKVEPGCEIIVPMKAPKDGSGLAATMGVLSSTTSMAAMVVTLMNNLR